MVCVQGRRKADGRSLAIKKIEVKFFFLSWADEIMRTVPICLLQFTTIWWFHGLYVASSVASWFLWCRMRIKLCVQGKWFVCAHAFTHVRICACTHIHARIYLITCVIYLCSVESWRWCKSRAEWNQDVLYANMCIYDLIWLSIFSVRTSMMQIRRWVKERWFSVHVCIT